MDTGRNPFVNQVFVVIMTTIKSFKGFDKVAIPS